MIIPKASSPASVLKTFLHNISADDSPALLMFALLFLQFYWKYIIWLSYDKIPFFLDQSSYYSIKMHDLVLHSIDFRFFYSASSGSFTDDNPILLSAGKAV